MTIIGEAAKQYPKLIRYRKIGLAPSRGIGTSMAGYSGTPLAKKLGIMPGAKLLLVNAPEDMAAWLAPLPEGVKITSVSGKGSAGKDGAGDQDVIVFFTTEAKELTRRFGALAKGLQPAGGLWVAWPKKASKAPTDLSESVVRKFGLCTGMVDNKVCAVSEVWSGLRFVRRIKDR